MRYLLIKNNKVENIIIADPSFIATIESDYDFCMLSDDLISPDKWTKTAETDAYVQPMTIESWSKDGESDVFVDPFDETWTYNESVSDETWTHVMGTIEPQIGWSYDGEDFSPPIEE